MIQVNRIYLIFNQLRNVLSVVRFFVFLVFTNVGGRGMPDSALKLWDGRVELFILRGRECSSRLYLLQLLMFPLLRLYNS